MALPWSSLAPLALSLVNDAVLVLDRRDALVWANDRLLRWTGWTLDQVTGRAASALWEEPVRWDDWRAGNRLQGGGAPGHETLALATAAGDSLPVEAHLTPLGRSWVLRGGSLLVLQDLRPAQWLEKLVREDPLTGVSSRQGILDRLETDLVRAKRFGALLGIVLLDVDGFQGLNDRWGAAFGDQVLRVVGADLREAVTPVGAAGRLGSDEFLVVLPQGGGTTPESVARKLRAGLEGRLFSAQGEPVTVTASFCVALLHPSAADEATDVLARLHRGLDRARSLGPNRVEPSP